MSSPPKRVFLDTNSLVNRFANFLRLRGRFRDISFNEEDRITQVIASPLFPQMPELKASIQEGSTSISVEINGDEPEYLQEESTNFFDSANMGLQLMEKIFGLEQGIEVTIKGTGEFYEKVCDNVVESLGDTSIERQTTRLTFNLVDSRPKRELSASKPKEKPDLPSRFSAPSAILRKERELTQLRPTKPKTVPTPTPTTVDQVVIQSPVTTATPSSIEPVQEESEQLAPSDVLSENERTVIEAIQARPKKKAQSNLLVKPTGFDQETLRQILRSLVKKGILVVQSGWYSVRDIPSTIQLQKKKLEKESTTASSLPLQADEIPSPIPTEVSLTDNEKLVISAIRARPKRKAQSNLLTRPTGLDRDTLRQILRGLVERGILTVSYGWYILPSNNEQPGGSRDKEDEGELLYETDLDEESMESTAKELWSEYGTFNHLQAEEEVDEEDINDEQSLLHAEKKVIEVIRSRPHQKAQPRLLVSQTGLTQSMLRPVLRSLVNKRLIELRSGWYHLIDI